MKHHHVTKQLKYLSGPDDTYRVDLHRVFHALNDAGFDWDSFCAETGIEQDKVPEVKVGFVMALAEHLKLKDPNKLFASPPRAKLAKGPRRLPYSFAYAARGLRTLSDTARPGPRPS